jgi:hypothetical protein
MQEPGTNPPPKTKSSSAVPVAILGISLISISDKVLIAPFVAPQNQYISEKKIFLSQIV